jgi:hypothetical protein
MQTVYSIAQQPTCSSLLMADEEGMQAVYSIAQQPTCSSLPTADEAQAGRQYTA